MKTTYLPEVAVSAIFKHPKNPRHKATADPELVDSVKTQGLVQPLIVAPRDCDGPLPHPERYVLIAGHRRLDALKKNKSITTQAVVRRDLVTEGQQIEAMLVENGRRQDLTAIEEAEGYEQLELLGYKPTAIATAVGRDVKTVRSRLKLLKLSKPTREKVHAGQMTLDDAAAMVEFADDPDISKRLEQATANNFRYEVERAKRIQEAKATAAATMADLLDLGATELPPPENTNQGYWTILADAGVAQLNATPFPEPADHAGCLAFMVLDSDHYGPRVYTVCDTPANHADTKTGAEATAAKDRAERDAEHQRLREEHTQRQAAADAAAQVRTSTLMDLVGPNTQMPPQLRDLVRTLLPAALIEKASSGMQAEIYQRALNIPEPDRWISANDNRFHTNHKNDGFLFAEHLKDIDQWSDGMLTRALLAFLIDSAEASVTAAPSAGEPNADTRFALRYLDLLEQAGHPFSDVDTQLRDDIAAIAEPDTDAEGEEVA